MSKTVDKEQLQNQIDIMVHQHGNIVAQIEQLKQQQQMAVANANAAEGAIQVLKYLISTIDDGAGDFPAPVDAESIELANEMLSKAKGG